MSEQQVASITNSKRSSRRPRSRTKLLNAFDSTSHQFERRLATFNQHRDVRSTRTRGNQARKLRRQRSMSVLVKSALPIVILSVSMLPISSAGAWERHTKTVGPHGKTVTTDARGSCTGGNCRSVRHAHVSDGKDLQRAGTVNCHKDTCVGKIRITGPDGVTVTRIIRVQE